MPEEVVGSSLFTGHAVGIAVTRIPSGTLHTGVVYRHGGQVWLYHQGWHIDTKNELLHEATARIGGSTLVVSIRLLDARQKTVTSLLRHLARAKRQYAYTLEYDPESVFDGSGKFQSNETAGLACSSLVLTIFHNCSMPMVDFTAWPDATDDDLRMQVRLVCLLSAKDLPHAQRIVREIGCKRIRPDHVGGVGYYPTWPVTFQQADSAAADLCDRIDA